MKSIYKSRKLSVILLLILVILVFIALFHCFSYYKNYAGLDEIDVTEQTHFSDWMTAALRHNDKDITALGDFEYVVSKMNLISFNCTILDNKIDAVKFAVIIDVNDLHYEKNFQINNKGVNFASSDMVLRDRPLSSNSNISINKFMEIIDNLSFQQIIEKLGNSNIYDCSLCMPLDSFSIDLIGENDLLFYENNFFCADECEDISDNISSVFVLSFAGNTGGCNVFVAY